MINNASSHQNFKTRFTSFWALLILLIIFSCESQIENPIEKALQSNNEKIKKVVENIEQHEIQILFSEVIKDEDQISFLDFSYQVVDSNYFYPASTVKFPIALLALEKLGQTKGLNIDTPFRVEGDSLTTSFREEINKLFAVSDNLAYTRLFEYLGKDYINDHLESLGITSRISHRFSVPNPYDLETKPIHFFNEDSAIYTTKSYVSKNLKPLELNRIKKGEGYIENDSLISHPMDFSLKNYLPLSSLHNMMKQFVFPEAFGQDKQFDLSETHKEFFLNAMRNLPFEVGYDRTEYYDSYVKFLIFGDTKAPIPDSVKIYNKVGYAFGYLTDCAYIVNEKTNKEYIITATIHVNENKIFNDDNYEYESIGIPFLAELGRELVLNN
ncbi:serine hydrolase [Winogradskyella poriferorum]|uniref:serine hydrolase n=1 Tax=Winogradskyella poriferorum TaxID=307627 RepID=UPI003D6609C4